MMLLPDSYTSLYLSWAIIGMTTDCASHIRSMCECL